MVWKKGQPQHFEYRVKQPCGKAHAACGLCNPRRSERIRARMTGRPRTPEQVANMRHKRWGVTPPVPPVDRFGQPAREKPLSVGIVSHVFPCGKSRGRGIHGGNASPGFTGWNECWVVLEKTGEEVLARTARGVEVKRGDRVQLKLDGGRNVDKVVAVI